MHLQLGLMRRQFGGSGTTPPIIPQSLIEYTFSESMPVDANGSVYIQNDGTGGSDYDGLAFGSNLVYFNGTDQSVDLPISYTIDASSNVTVSGYITYFDVMTKQFKQLDSGSIPVSTSFTQTDSFSTYFPHDGVLTQADLDAMNADQNLIYRVWFGNETLPSGFSKANMAYTIDDNGSVTAIPSFVPAVEGEAGGSFINDIGNVSQYEIINYTDSCRTTLKNCQFGPSNFLLKQDGSGIPIATADIGTIDFTNDDGRYVNTQWIPIDSYSIREIVELDTGLVEDRMYTTDSSQTTAVEMVITSSTEPTFDNDGILTVTDNGDGTWHVISDDTTYCRIANTTDNMNNITGVELLCTDGLISGFDNMFIYCNPTTVTFGDIYSGEQINMFAMMYGWSNITTPPDLSSFDTSNMENMSNMMGNWHGITTPPDLSSFDTSKVTNMFSMMYEWHDIITPPDLSSFDTSNVTSMAYMMSGWNSINTPPDLSSFDTSNVTNISNMMYNWASIPEIGNIGVENFNVTSLTNAVNFAKDSKFATATYDTILVNWEAQITAQQVADGLTEIHFGNSQYTAGSAAETARNNLIALGINIIDGGAA